MFEYLMKRKAEPCVVSGCTVVDTFMLPIGEKRLRKDITSTHLDMSETLLKVNISLKDYVMYDRMLWLV